MKHSVGHYYEDPKHLCGDATVSRIQDKLDSMAREYRLLDDAVKEGANLTGVKYIVLPDVGANDKAVISRTADLDRLFTANPDLTLVIAFSDEVETVYHQFCVNRYESTLPKSIQHLSFTGKNLLDIMDRFVCFARSLISVDFRGLVALQEVQGFFLAGASSLTSVDFNKLGALHRVGECFCGGAQSLAEVDIKGLVRLVTERGANLRESKSSLVSIICRNNAQSDLIKPSS